MKIIFKMLFIFLFTTSCGFTIVEKDLRNKFEISEITTSGDSRINYKIKNKILFTSSNLEKKLIDMKLQTVKAKEIKEKNIRNEITKYQITITAKVLINRTGNNNVAEFNIIKSGDFNVSNQHSQTLNDEKKLINLLIDDLAKEILDEIFLRVDDL